MTRYLTGRGLTVQRSESGFLIRATGSSDRVTAAFGTTLRTYRDQAGTRLLRQRVSRPDANSSLAPDVLGVIGLSDTLRMRSAAKLGFELAALRRCLRSPASCQPPLPDAGVLHAGNRSSNVPDTEVPRGYGGGPGCSGLTPEQGNSIYGAPDAGPRGKGAGVTLALFELSAYQPSDIATWARTFYGPGYTPPISAINVDGGPLSPACPAGDECVPGSDAYYYDVEPVADIDTMLMISPDARNVEVYDAPNDELGITYARPVQPDSRQRRQRLGGQLQLGHLRERLELGLRAGGEHDLPADGGARPEHVRRHGRHRCVRLHPQ